METVTLADLVEFADKRRVRKKLLASERIESELVCYEPGQGTREHFHALQDEIFYIVEGRGTVCVDGERIDVSAGSLVLSHADQRHSIEVADDSRMVMMFFKAPAAGAAREK